MSGKRDATAPKRQMPTRYVARMGRRTRSTQGRHTSQPCLAEGETVAGDGGSDSIFKQRFVLGLHLAPLAGQGEPNSIFKQQDGHCEPTGRANARSTYSVVIRGLDPRIHLLKGISRSGWIAGSGPAMTATSVRDERSLAPFAGPLTTASRSRRMFRARFAIIIIRPLQSEGAGNAGRPMHPQPRVRYG
jgi:hypothetical protein